MPSKMPDKGNKAIIENPSSQNLAELIRPTKAPLTISKSNETNPRFSIAVLIHGKSGASYARTGMKKIGTTIETKPRAIATPICIVSRYLMGPLDGVYFCGHFFQHDGVAKPLVTQLA